MKKIIGFLILVLIMLNSCKSRICEGEDLAFLREDNIQTRIKTNGYFYKGSSYFILYQNGILITSKSSANRDSLDVAISSLDSPELSSQYIWGVWRLTDSIIQLSYWQPGMCIKPRTLNTVFLINDTTFIIQETNFLNKGETTITQISDTFHFRAFSPKPDSTNDFIE